jgi:hypothetical protein
MSMLPNQAWIDFMRRWLAPKPDPEERDREYERESKYLEWQSRTPLADKQSTKPKPIEASEAELASIVKLDAELSKNSKAYSDTRARFSNILRAASNKPVQKNPPGIPENAIPLTAFMSNDKWKN